LVDRLSLGHVTALDLNDALNDLGLYALKEDVSLFVKRYDRNNDGRLRYSEFCDAFTPQSVIHSSTVKSRSAYYMTRGYPRNEYFARDTREQLLKTFKVHFSVESSAEYLRKRLLRRPGFNISDAFQAVDVDNNGYLTRDEFKKLLRDHRFYATEEEVTWLVDRYDRNQDGRISYSEFMDEILPKSPNRR
jgi:Ca2+-binding EF-hand superfamily protein